MSIPDEAMMMLSLGTDPRQVLAAVRRSQAEREAADRAWCDRNGWEFRWGAPLPDGYVGGTSAAAEPTEADRAAGALVAIRTRRRAMELSVDAWAMSRPDAPARLTRPPSVAPVVWQACVHESGHAVAAIVLGLQLNSVFATPEGRGTTESVPTDCAVVNAAMLLAGAEGENLFTPGGPFPPSASDLKLLNEQTTDPAVHDRAKSAARGILAANAPAVERVALLLLSRGYLSGTEATAAAGEVRRTPTR